MEEDCATKLALLNFYLHPKVSTTTNKCTLFQGICLGCVPPTANTQLITIGAPQSR